MTRGVLRGLAAAVVVLAGVAAGCEEVRDGHCVSQSDCSGGMVCDMQSTLCVAPNGIDASVGGSRAGAGGSQAGSGGNAAAGNRAGGAGTTSGMDAPVAGNTADAGPPPCKVDKDCTDTTKPICETTSGKCVECLKADRCPVTAPVCSPDHRCAKCTVDADCTGRTDGLKTCNVATGACVECVKGDGCPATAPVCSTERRCAKCTADADCAGRADGLKACDVAAGACVTCVKDADCTGVAGTPVCDTAAKKCVQCLTGAQCSGTTPICGGDRKCAKCTESPQCVGLNDPQRRFCSTGSGACVQCLESDSCSDKTPFCSNNACVSCGGSDAKCVGAKAEPGLCLDDGHCARQDEVVFVKYRPACDSVPAGGDGSLEMPFCNLNGAKTKLSSGRKIVVVRGVLSDRWALDQQVSVSPTIVGQQSAEVAWSTGTVVDVTAGDVTVRGVTVTGGSASIGVRADGTNTKLTLSGVTVRSNGNVGVVATNGASLRMTGGSVVNNDGGGIRTDGAAFDITNTIIAGNALPNGDPAVSLGASPGAATFLNNTIADNKTVGVLCTSTKHDVRGSVFFGNALDTVGCTYSACCSGNPLFSTNYRLGAGSPCIDKLPPNMSTAVDIDGKARPVNGQSDCGASEWSP